MNPSDIKAILARLPGSRVGNITDRIKNNEDTRAIEMVEDIEQTLAPKSILEIGTHVGGSATLWLSLTSAKLTTVDIGAGWVSHDDLHTVHRILGEHFPGRLTGIIGDSISKEVFDQIAGATFDLMFVDGDHTYAYAKADIETGLKLGIPYFLIDDFNTCEDIRRAAKDTGLVHMKDYPDVHNPSKIGLALFKAP